MVEIYFLIPTTSKNRDYNKITDCDFLKILFSSLIKNQDPQYEYNFILGYDYNDSFFNTKSVEITNFVNKHNNCTCTAIKIPILYNTLVRKWNYLYEIAILEENSFFYFQIGDDVRFSSKGWEEEFISLIAQNNFLGIVGPIDTNNKSLLTQVFLTRRHWNIFGFLFHPAIENWYCDNWINDIYKPLYFVKSKTKVINESGNASRYNVVHVKKDLLSSIIAQSKSIFNTYLKSLNIVSFNLSKDTDISEIWSKYSKAYIIAKKNNFELVISRNSNFKLRGFNPIIGYPAKQILPFSDVNISVSEINELKHEAYGHIITNMNKIYPTNCLVICYKKLNGVKELDVLNLVEKYVKKWQPTYIYWFSDLKTKTNLSESELINLCVKVKYIIYTINIPIAYELIIKNKIENVLEIKPLKFKNDNYMKYYLPLSFDTNLTRKLPDHVMIPFESTYILYFSKFNIVFYQSEGDIERYLEQYNFVLILFRNILNIPIIDHNYPLVIDGNNNYCFVQSLEIFRLYKKFSVEELFRVIPVLIIKN